ncbi:MAG TPA: DUF4331 family protein [Kofleriaceae bacterium]|nr:DUF4331 family protein [Kofleriaceae bacterium]
MTTKIIILSIAFVASCHDDNPGASCAPGTTLMDNQCVPDSTCGSGTTLMDGMCVPTSSTPTYVQVEQLARPGINEALVISNANLEGYNATAPSFAGAPPDAVAAITKEAKTVLQALYLGGCLLDGVLGLTADTGVHPAGATCNAVGGALFSENNPLTGVTLTPATMTAAQAYADRVFAQFEPDVMRIDTSLPTSGYLNLCGDPTTNKPLLCGGRFLTDDVIDVTYNYLLAGAAITTSSPAQFRALVGDGVNFSVATPGAGTVSVADGTNGAQGHPAVSQGFPYSAPPF